MINVTISDELIKKLISSESSIVHAHWINYIRYIPVKHKLRIHDLKNRDKETFLDVKCSNCGFWIRVSDSLIPKMVYCPHCGAKMDGERSE